MQQAHDFLAESEALAAAIAPLAAEDYGRVTQFKGWTVDDVLGHLHMFNLAADAALRGDAAFEAFFAPVAAAVAAGRTLREIHVAWLDGLGGPALFEAWREGYRAAAARYADADPKTRVRWAGPDMSARSCITARQMETWAHGHTVFDLLGRERAEDDRIRNVAHLGVTTFGWSFANRGEPVPDPAPHVRLTAPSGDLWEWNEPQEDNRVSGSAVGFCQTVAQVRNVADTDMETVGPIAAAWMARAQCFAGPPIDPPAPGTRHVERPGRVSP